LSLQRARDEEYAGSNFFVDRGEESSRHGLNEEWNAFERGQCERVPDPDPDWETLETPGSLESGSLGAGALKEPVYCLDDPGCPRQPEILGYGDFC
jgi:hypothetical protein